MMESVNVNENREVFETSRAIEFRDYLKVLNSVQNEPTLKFSWEGLTTIEMDPSHVSMYDLSLPNAYFDQWAVKEDFKVCLNLEDALKALSKISKDDYSLTLENHPVDEKITFTLKSDIHRRKTIKTLEDMENEVPMPRIFFKSKTRILLKALKRIVEDFKGFEHIEIKTDYDKITFTAENDSTTETTPLDNYNDNILEHRIEEPTRTVYTLDYLQQILKHTHKISEVCTLEFSEDMPMKLDIEIPQGHLHYYLAPCIGA